MTVDFGLVLPAGPRKNQTNQWLDELDASLRLTWFGRLAVGKSEAAAEALSDGQWTKNNALVGAPPQVVEQLQQFIELGVDYFMVEVLGLTNPEIIGTVLAEVLPKVRE